MIVRILTGYAAAHHSPPHAALPHGRPGCGGDSLVLVAKRITPGDPQCARPAAWQGRGGNMLAGERRDGPGRCVARPVLRPPQFTVFRHVTRRSVLQDLDDHDVTAARPARSCPAYHDRQDLDASFRYAHELGHLPWFAALFLRAFFLRDFFAIAVAFLIQVQPHPGPATRESSFGRFPR